MFSSITHFTMIITPIPLPSSKRITGIIAKFKYSSIDLLYTLLL